MAHILIIDDSPSIRMFLEQTLAQADHIVVSAVDGKQGLKQMQQQRFDLVITDIFMPEADGIETIRHARDKGMLPRIIAISSKDSIVNLLPAARLMGAMRTLQKPFTAAQLIETVSAVLQLPPPGRTPPGS
jgi:two-component system, chemotaxis family, chemotaxis protein CheY